MFFRGIEVDFGMSKRYGEANHGPKMHKKKLAPLAIHGCIATDDD